ncbi:MAG: sugar kinase [Anaerolineae bacterium]|nr:sugar kinase [Anaerolineae bacterium]
MSFDIIAIGEALVEIMRPTVGQPLDRPGDFVGPFASGAPAIFAVAAARLGASVGFISGLGDDAFGRLMLARLAAEGVDTAQMQTMPAHATGVAFVAYAQDGRREFVFHLRHAAAGVMDADQLDPAYFQGVKWLHLSGSTIVLNSPSRDACRRALELTQAAGGRISFDPNLRPELMPIAEARRVFAPFLTAADLLLPTVEEARVLADTADDDLAAQKLLAGRDRTVVLKRGEAGCTLYTAAGRVDVPGFAVAEVDPTGAGDCFNAACVIGLEAGWPPEQIARFATAAGALAVTQQGPMEGAPTRAEVEAMLNKEG